MRDLGTEPGQLIKDGEAARTEAVKAQMQQERPDEEKARVPELKEEFQDLKGAAQKIRRKTGMSRGGHL